MKKLIESIIVKKFDEANAVIEENFNVIMRKKLVEMKKMIGAKSVEEQRLPMNKRYPNAASKVRAGINEDELEESDLPITTQKQKTDTYRHKKSGREIVATKHPGDEYEKLNEVSDVAKRNYLAAVHHKSGLFRGVKRTSLQGIKNDAETIASAADRSRKNPGKTAYSTQSLEKAHKNLEKKHERRSEIAKKVASSLGETTEDQLDEKRGLWDNIHAKRKRIEKGSGEKMRKPGSEGAPSDEDLRKSQNEETLDEAQRIKIVKARIRKGKIERRRRVATMPGFTFRGGKLTRMSPSERRRRKMGQRRGKIKRKAKLSRALMKRKRSLMKRRAIGLR